jgi:hypothetical protein
VGVRASFETDDLFFPLFHHPRADMPANLEEFPFAQPRSLTLPPAKEGDGIMKIEPKPSDWEVLAGLVERVTASRLPSLDTRQSLRPVSGSWPRANGSTNAPTASSSKRGSCGAPRWRLGEAAVVQHFQERMPYGLLVPEVDAAGK